MKKELKAVLEVLEVLAGLCFIWDFLFGYSLSRYWGAINGLQIIVQHTMLRVVMTYSVRLFHALLRKIATFEVIDGDWLKENV